MEKESKELPVLIGVIIANTPDPTAEKVMKQVVLIQDLLAIQRSRMFFIPTRTKSGKKRKDQSLIDILEKRIEQDVFGTNTK